MSTWLCIPSKRPTDEVGGRLRLWRERGYRICLCRDDYGAQHGPFRTGDSPRQSLNPHPLPDIALDSIQNWSGYPGYAVATNAAISAAMQFDKDAEWFVIGGDDVEPDPNHSAEEIAQQCTDHFMMLNATREYDGMARLRTFGVMQPTGDRWGERPNHPNPALRSAYIDRVCGSAWLGREFCRRVYGGKGPLWPEYTHMYADEELQCVAETLGVLWQRRDLTQLHRHWGRVEQTHPPTPYPRTPAIPDFLREANSPEHWKKYGNLFRARKAAGFPGSELI